MRSLFAAALCVTVALAAAPARAEAPGWFEKDREEDGQFILFCDAEGTEEDATLAAARQSCARRLCLMFGEQVSSETEVIETLIGTEARTRTVSACPDVRLIGKEEWRKSVDCFRGACTAHVMQAYPRAAFEAEMERLSRPVEAALLDRLFRAIEVPVPERPSLARLTVSGDVAPLWRAGGTYFHLLMDGQSVLKCGPDDVTGRCGMTMETPAGPHVLEYHVVRRNPDRARPDRVYAPPLRVWLPGGEETEIDLAVLAFDGTTLDVPDHPEMTFPEAPQSCRAGLEALAAASLCDEGELDRLIAAAEATQAACAAPGSDLPSTAWGARMLDFAVDAVERQSFGRCWPKWVAKPMPYAMLGTGQELWPTQYDKELSTWRWSRDLPEALKDEAVEPARRLAGLAEALEILRPRIAITDAMVTYFYNHYDRPEIAKEGFDSLTALSDGHDFTLDPFDPAGHVNHYLLSDRFRFGDIIPHRPAFGARMAAYVAATPAITCVTYTYVGDVMKYFAADDAIDAGEWAAVRAMMENTPPGEQPYRCMKAFEDGASPGGVPLADRRDWLARWSCARDDFQMMQRYGGDAVPACD